jgi:hypothetical protein
MKKTIPVAPWATAPTRFAAGDGGSDWLVLDSETHLWRGVGLVRALVGRRRFAATIGTRQLGHFSTLDGAKGAIEASLDAAGFLPRG